MIELLSLGYVKLIGLVALAAILITFIAYFISGRRRWGKYVPAIIFMAFAIYSIYTLDNNLSSSEWVDKIMLFVLCIGGGIISALTGLIIGIYNKEKKSKKVKNKIK